MRKTPSVNINKRTVDNIRIKATSRLYKKSEAYSRPAIKRENSMTMLVNTKTKLSNQNHIQNSLKSVNSNNPTALYRMMNPKENGLSLMNRQKEEEEKRPANQFVMFREKLRQ